MNLLSLAAGLTALTFGAPVLADEAPVREYKLTVGSYHYSAPDSDRYSGQDLNLRVRQDDTNAWVAAYHDRVFGSQARTGFDTTLTLAPDLSLQPSLQAATRGFLGGSVNLQYGDPWFAVVGWGRTNLKPYYNLNWDPNDAITVGAGWHGKEGRTLSVTLIADDRLHTHQRDLHFYSRWPVSPDLRLTLDLLHKTGLGDSGEVNAWGWSATLDLPHWFLRLAHDPKQNFSTQDADRVSVGVRF